MKLFSKFLLALTASLALISCSKNQPSPAAGAPAAADLAPDVEEIRTILIQGDSKCQLSAARGRNEPVLVTPKSCQFIKTSAGDISSVVLIFDPPCKQYTMNNLIGALYFLDEKSIAGKNKDCPIESFKASYGWSISQ